MTLISELYFKLFIIACFDKYITSSFSSFVMELFLSYYFEIDYIILIKHKHINKLYFTQKLQVYIQYIITLLGKICLINTLIQVLCSIRYFIKNYYLQLSYKFKPRAVVYKSLNYFVYEILMVKASCKYCVEVFLLECTFYCFRNGYRRNY